MYVHVYLHVCIVYVQVVRVCVYLTVGMIPMSTCYLLPPLYRLQELSMSLNYG